MPATLARLLVVIGILAPVGVVAQQPSTTTSARSSVTFSKDIAPILQRACQNCHRPGSIAPMSLLTYRDARPWARSIKQKVSQREMPPWFVEKNIGIRKFKNDVSLTDQEIATIVEWVDNGVPEGDPTDMPASRQFADFNTWHIGKPDLIVTTPKEYSVAPNAPDQWVDYYVDPGLTEDRYIKLVSFQPHMHSRGKRQCIEAIYPDGRHEILNCAKVNFGWAIAYLYADDAAPLLPAGSMLHVINWHDNSSANRVNPEPRNWVGNGNRTVDEMSFSWVDYVALSEDEYNQGVAARLAARQASTNQQ